MFVQRLLALLRAEPAMVGTLVASVLPALVALNIISLDDRAIGLLVVAINAIVGFLVASRCLPPARMRHLPPRLNRPSRSSDVASKHPVVLVSSPSVDHPCSVARGGVPTTCLPPRRSTAL